jgi:CDP-glycerol glycerophosphotransferase (TagB/SpsB family)
MTIKGLIREFLNKLLPKSNKVIIIDHGKGESNAIEVANYIHKHYNLPVFLSVNGEIKGYARNILNPGVRLVNRRSIALKFVYLTSKYIFTTHGSIIEGTPNGQLWVNIWHGVGHKRIRLTRGRGEKGIPADITVATSDLSKKMFSESFGVPAESIFISGYPRNDLMIRAKKNKSILKEKIEPSLHHYDQVIFWMPTFTRNDDNEILKNKNLSIDGIFQISDFNVEHFNDILMEYNTLCLIKPHYFYSQNNALAGLNNIMAIDDGWIHRQGITLYHLLACTDVLITDFSSVMIDYTLLGQPVICFSTDLDIFKKTQGLYFEDIENWLPTKLHQNEEEFFAYLESILSTGKDPFIKKREKIRDLYFTYKDDKSTERLIEYVFNESVDEQPNHRDNPAGT